MKIGVRKPSIKKSISARTTGRAKRKLKRIANPFYGKKGMGWIRNPKRAAYNKVYRKTTTSTRGLTGCLFACIWYPFYGCFMLVFWMIKYGIVIMWGFASMIINAVIALVEWIINR